MTGRAAPTPPSSGADAGQRCDDPSVKCDHPHIVAIEYLDGSDAKELAGAGKQWVNLPRDAKWVDSTRVANIDRLTHQPRFKVRFDRPGSHNFNVKHLPDGSNVAYSAAEKGRNGRFKFEDGVKSYTTDADGTLIVPGDFFVAAAGKHKYKLEAKDDYGGKATSREIENYRLIYLVELKMTGLTSIASSVSTLVSEYAKHRIEIVNLGSAQVDHVPNIGNDTEKSAYDAKARTKYATTQGPAKEPYTIAVGYTDHLAVKNAGQRLVKSNVDVGPGKAAVNIPVRGPGLRAGDGVNDRALWKDIVPGEGWFVSATFLRNGGTAGSDDVSIPAAKVTAVQASGYPTGYCATVRVDVTGLPAGRGSITLVVNWVDRMRAGLAAAGNLIYICTRAWWTDQSTADQNQVMVHELGHMVHMVADGTGSGVDKVSTQYTGKGHVGSHCHNGLPVQASYGGSSTGTTCVMFGSTNGVSAFCGNCAPAVLKADLAAGWSAF